MRSILHEFEKMSVQPLRMYISPNSLTVLKKLYDKRAFPSLSIEFQPTLTLSIFPDPPYPSVYQPPQDNSCSYKTQRASCAYDWLPKGLERYLLSLMSKHLSSTGGSQSQERSIVLRIRRIRKTDCLPMPGVSK